MTDQCSNCGNKLPSVPSDKTPYQFCSKRCKEQYEEREKHDKSKEIADIYEGDYVQLWKDCEGDFQLRILCATIGIDKHYGKQVLEEIKNAVSKGSFSMSEKGFEEWKEGDKN